MEGATRQPYASANTPRYYRLEPGIHELYGIAAYPEFAQDLSFLTGRAIDVSPAAPLLFAVNYPPGQGPKHFLGMQVPVVSTALLQALSVDAADHLQSFAAVLLNETTDERIRGYHALNVIGLIEVPGNSQEEHLLEPGPKTRSALIARLREDPGVLLVH